MSWYKNLSFTQKMLFSMLTGAILGIILNNIDIYHSILLFFFINLQLFTTKVSHIGKYSRIQIQVSEMKRKL